MSGVRDVIDILQGAGVLEEHGTFSCKIYRWIAPGVNTEEELFLDSTIESLGSPDSGWISFLSRNFETYITPQQLALLWKKDSTSLVISTPRNSVEVKGNALTLALPKNDTFPHPECYLLESNDGPIRPSAFMPHADSDVSVNNSAASKENVPRSLTSNIDSVQVYSHANEEASGWLTPTCLPEDVVSDKGFDYFRCNGSEAVRPRHPFEALASNGSGGKLNNPLVEYALVSLGTR